MKKALLQFAAIILVGLFLLPNAAHAALIREQTDGSGNVFEFASLARQNFSPYQNFGGSYETIGAVQFKLALGNEGGLESDNCRMVAHVVGDDDVTYVSDPVYFADLPEYTGTSTLEFISAMEWTTFTFPQDERIDLSTVSVKWINVIYDDAYNTGLTCQQTVPSSYYAAAAISNGDVVSNESESPSYTGGDLAYRIYDGSGAPISYGTNWVDFENPPFANGLITPDFNNWQVCYNLATGAAGSNGINSGYEVIVSYGTSSPSLYTDKFSDSGFYMPVSHLPDSGCMILPKHSTSSTGSLVAQAGLYYRSLAGSYTFIASSSQISITIGSGDSVAFPGQEQKPDIQCVFDVSNTGVNTIDDVVNGIINGGCRLGVFLFVPDKNSFSRFSNVWLSIENKPPIGYFNVAKETVSGISTSTPATASITPATYSGVALLSVFVNPVDITLALLVSLAFVFFMFHRFRKIDL